MRNKNIDLIVESLKKVNEEEEFDLEKIKYLYHTVRDEKGKDYVLKSGIKADRLGHVYLSAKPMNKGAYAKKGHVFLVKIPKSDNLWDWRDMWEESLDKTYDPKNPYFIYEGDISLKYIEYVGKVGEVKKLVKTI